MHQILAGCCRANFPFHFGLTQLPWHTGHPFPTIPSGRCSGITRDKWKREGLVVPCSSDTHMHPSRHGSFQGCWEMLHFLFFFFFFSFPILPVPALGCWEWGKGAGYLRDEISTCATQLPQLCSLLAPFLCQAPPVEPGIPGKGSLTAFSSLHL